MDSRPAVVPESLRNLLETDVIAHVSALAPEGSIVTHVMWVDYDGEHVLTSSPKGSWKSRTLRDRPQVAISVVDPNDPWRRLSISGHVTEIRDDEELAFINKLSQRYAHSSYPRLGPREIFVITPDRVRAFEGRRA